jgi:phosphoribosylformylglycinamidine synthase subunit PurL
VLKPGKEDMAEAIFRKWELDFAVIGEVTDTGHMVLEWNGEVVCDIPLAPLADEAPLYDRPHLSREKYKVWAQVKPLGDIPESTDIGADLLKLMASPDIASRAWIWQQYDSQVGGDTAQLSGGDAAVVRIHGTNRALAMTTDCTPRYCYADPYEGGKQAVAETYRNLCAVGAKPLAITNCLNFANPQRPEIMAQIVGCLEGMADACRALDYPIVSGNVSLYNESKATGGGSAILPTPAIGGVGILDDVRKMATIGFKNEGDDILLIGGDEAEMMQAPHLGQSIWLREILGKQDGDAPSVNLDLERDTGELIRSLIIGQTVNSVHDVSDGGPLVAAVEMALAGNIGALLAIHGPNRAVELQSMFSENQGYYLAAVSNEKTAEVEARCFEAGIECVRIGRVGGSAIEIVEMNDGKDDAIISHTPLTDLRAAHESFFKNWMEA